MEQDNATVVEKVENTNPQGDISTKDSDVQKRQKALWLFYRSLQGRKGGKRTRRKGKI